MIGEMISQIAIWALPVLMAIVFHEVAHGWVAYCLGDSTAARMGRLTLNPVPHIDLFGTVLLPLLLVVLRAPFLFGYAKPVPVNYYNLKHPKRDMVWVALAGPATNLLLAVAGAVIFKLIVSVSVPTDGAWTPLVVSVLTPLAYMADATVRINIVLAVFNAFPIPPLDGGRVLVGLLPEPHSSLVARIEPYGFVIILILLMSHTLDAVMIPAMRFLFDLLNALL